MGFISKIPRSFRYGAKWRKPLSTLPTTTCPKVKSKFLSMYKGLLGPYFAYLSLQAHLPPYSGSCFPCTFTCKHNVISHLCWRPCCSPNLRLLPLFPTLPSILLTTPIHPLRLNSGPRAAFSKLPNWNFQCWLLLPRVFFQHIYILKILVPYLLNS